MRVWFKWKHQSKVEFHQIAEKRKKKFILNAMPESVYELSSSSSEFQLIKANTVINLNVWRIWNYCHSCARKIQVETHEHEWNGSIKTWNPTYNITIIINIVTCPFTVLLNVLMIIALKTRSSVRTNSNILLACLAVTVCLASHRISCGRYSNY